MPARLKAVLYLALNILSGTGIVFLNKVAQLLPASSLLLTQAAAPHSAFGWLQAVFTIFNFHYIYALTCIHAVTTCLGMYTFSYCGLFETKTLPSLRVMPLAGERPVC